MTSEITARVPKVDWSQEFDRHWNGGNPSVTHTFNALSLLFPQAETFFIEVAREVIRNLDGNAIPDVKKDVTGFIAQESMHTHQHNKYNRILERQGFENVVHDFVSRLQARSHRKLSSLSKLAIVCGYEHYTAILGNYILRNPEVLEPASPNMALIWGWHSAEETEHKAVCFDLYRAAGGGWLRRVALFLLVTLNFNLMFFRLYFSLLYRDGCLELRRLPRTIRQSSSFFFGRSGVAWHLLGHGLRYLGPGFHPWQQDNRSALESWLSANRDQLRVLGHKNAY